MCNKWICVFLTIIITFGINVSVFAGRSTPPSYQDRVNKYEEGQKESEREEKDIVYDDIYNNLVYKCIDMIENNQYEEAYNYYKNYVYSLCKKHDVDYQQTDSGC